MIGTRKPNIDGFTFPDEGLPCIVTTNRQLPEIAADAMAALCSANAPPTLFQRGTKLVRLRRDQKGRNYIEIVDRSILRSVLADSAAWLAIGNNDSVKSVSPPMEVVDYIMTLPEWDNIPYLTRIVTAPLVEPNGSLITKPGYQEFSGLYYSGEEINLPSLDTHPKSLRHAVSLLLDDLLGDFPFADQASKANTLALIALPFVRDMVEGPTPAHIIDAPSRGTGKTLLAKAAAMPFDPEVAEMPPVYEEAEWRKRITSVLREARPYVFIDNIEGKLASPSLATAITGGIWEDRQLGGHNILRLSPRCVWLFTGNNLAMSSDMARRSIWIRLDAQIDRPWLRSGFRHPALMTWARENRPRLVAAVLTLVRNWLDLGQPDFSGRVPGMFESWGRVIGGILEAAEISEFLANSDEHYDRADGDRESWIWFVRAWWGHFSTHSVGVKELLKLAVEQELLEEIVSGTVDRANQTRLGIALRDKLDLVYGEIRIQKAASRKGAAQYRLTRLDHNK